MSTCSFLLDDATDAYVRAHTEPADEARRCWSRTAALGDTPACRSAPTRVRPDRPHPDHRAAVAVEVGTFTGMSSLCHRPGPRAGGRLICCDVSEEWTRIAREAWAPAGVDDRIELDRPGDDTLRRPVQ